MADEKSHSTREDLAGLRIDPEQRSARRRPAWLGPVAVLGFFLLFILASTWAYRLTLGHVESVSVAYAQRTGSGADARGSVLAGAGYIVTRDRYISLGVRVPGRIDAYLVDEGESVVEGQALVQLDARQYQANFDEAQAGLRLARANVELRRKELVRLKELRNADVSSQAELDVKINQLRVAEAEVDRLEAELDRIKLDVDDTILRAPTNGVVLEKLKEVGEIATPGGFAGSGELIRMANVDELRAEVDVNEADLGKVRIGQDAKVVPDAFPDRSYPASVVKLYTQVNRQKGTLKVEVRILEPDKWLRPDMSVRITFLAAAPDEPDESAVIVPRDALRRDSQGPFVWVVTNGRLRRQSIQTTGDAPGNRVVVSAGLDGGEALVVGEVAELVEGQAVDSAD